MSADLQQARDQQNGRPRFKAPCSLDQVQFRQYTGEEDLPHVMQLVDNELSEPYSIFTYRFFLQNWPQLCWFAFDGEQCFGVVVCKTEYHRDLLRGYVGMLVVLQEYRGLGVGSELVRRCIKQMVEDKADEVVLECEVSNRGGLALYQNLGFLRDKRLVRYYLSGNDAFRLKLLLPLHPDRIKEMEAQDLLNQANAPDTSQEQPPGIPPLQAGGPSPSSGAQALEMSDRSSHGQDTESVQGNQSVQSQSTLESQNPPLNHKAHLPGASKHSSVQGLGNGVSSGHKVGKKRTKKK